MRIEAYLYAFRMLVRSITADQEMLDLYRRNKTGFLHTRFKGKNSFTAEENEVVLRILFNEVTFHKKLEKKKRLYDRFVVKLSRCIAEIRDDRYREFLILHYLYDVPAEVIADKKNYAERSVYRLGKEARKRLEKEILAVSPKPKREDRPRNERYIISERSVLLCCSNRVRSGKNRKAALLPKRAKA